MQKFMYRMCSKCKSIHTKDEWLEHGDTCPECYHTGFTLVQGTETDASNPVNFFRQKTQTPRSAMEKRSINKRIVVVIAVVIVTVALGILLSHIRLPSSPEVPVIETTVTPLPEMVATEVASTEVIATEMHNATADEVIIYREHMTERGIIPVKTPWNKVKTIQVILYSLAMAYAIMDRIMSRQIHDAIIAILMAAFTQFGSSQWFDAFAEKLLGTHSSGNILNAHWIWALIVLIISVFVVVYTSWQGTRDWTPTALYFGLIAGGPIFFGHFGVIQTLCGTPMGTAMPIIMHHWVTWGESIRWGDILISVLTYIIWAVAIGFALREALKPYRHGSVSYGSLILIALSIGAYVVVRISGVEWFGANSQLAYVIIILAINSVIASFIRERLDLLFRITIDYKIGVGKMLSQFDVLMSIALISLFLIQVFGHV